MNGAVNDPYTVLGIPRDADAEAVKRAYRAAALRDHPDRNPGDPAAEERFKSASEAYATLRDPEARRRFDAYAATGGPPGGVPRPDFGTVDWRAIFREADVPIDWSRAGGAATTGHVVFDALFQGVARAFRHAGLVRGEDRELTLRLDFVEAQGGTARRVHVPGPVICTGCGGGARATGAACATCGGEGVLRAGTEVDVQVPAGVRPGQKLRLQGMGGPGRPPGDAFVVLDVALPLGARFDGRDVRTDVFVSPAEARDGAVVRVLGREVRVPAGARDGQTLVVTGGGLGGGVLRATLRIDPWRALTRDAVEWTGVRLARPMATVRDVWRRATGAGGGR
ncbi:MAG: DnaJ domain-containing protein [Trueperaceae bacterium]